MSESAAVPDAIRIARTLIRLVQYLDQQLRTSGQLSVREISLLRQITRGCDHPTGLARELRLDPARVSRLTDRLVNLGYVTRSPDPADRRRWRLAVTPAGQERVESGRATLARAIDDILEKLSTQERDELLDAVSAVQRELTELDRQNAQGD